MKLALNPPLPEGTLTSTVKFNLFSSSQAFIGLSARCAELITRTGTRTEQIGGGRGF